MKIGIVGTIWLNTPPEDYGGTEEVVYNLVNELVERGHDVTFFGPATANVQARIIPTIPAPLREVGISWKNFTYTLYHMTEAFDMARHFDILHVHVNKSQDLVSLPFSVYKNTPTLFTIHFPFPRVARQPAKEKMMTKYHALPFTSISQTQQKGSLNYIATVYNGINLMQYPFHSNPEDYFAWLGKISQLKGTHEAILAAKRAKVKLVIMGAIEYGVSQNLAYFKEQVRPLIDNKQIIFYESIALPEKADILGKAKALLNPITWEEPFGLVMVESQATGTPVIAFKHGAAPEVIKQNKTGFLVHSVDEMVEKMKEVETLKREDCRKYIEKHFSVQQMVSGYEDAYKKTIKNWDAYYQDQLKLIDQSI